MALFIDKHVFEYKFFKHCTSTLEHALIILKCKVNEHVFMNLVALGKKLAFTKFGAWQSNVSFGN